MEAPPVTVMPVTGGTINMMEYLLQGKLLYVRNIRSCGLMIAHLIILRTYWMNVKF